MSKNNVGGAAFPTPHDPLYLGMSLRDYFAAKAMQSLIINTDENSAFEADLWIGSIAYEIADAMLNARQK